MDPSLPSSPASAQDAAADPRKQLLSQLQEMGFTSTQAASALSATSTVEQALEWLQVHGDEKEAPVAKSIRCVDTGKLFRSMADAMIYAERTGHSNFEETDEAIPPLTEAGKRERLEKVKQLVKDKVANRESTEKTEALERERKRRAGGQEMGKIREEQAALQLKRDADARERERVRFKEEQKKLREQVARDKAERAMEKAQRLGTGSPKEAYDLAYAKAIGAHDEQSAEEKTDAAIEVLASYKLGGKGLECVRTLAKMLGNVSAHPQEAKFRRVNLHNDAFKAKVGALKGGLAVLKAAGFAVAEEDENFLVLDVDNDMQRLNMVVQKLRVAEPKFA
jgi:hypothetical protein